MAQLYEYQLPQLETNSSRLVDTIVAGGYSVRITFQWSIASAEQYEMIKDWIDRQANADPLVVNDSYITDYDWLQLYLDISSYTDTQLETWLNKTSGIPKSLMIGSMYSRKVLVRNRISQCKALSPAVDQYKEVMRWQFRAVINDEVTVGVIEPGGWYRNQDASISFRFVSDLDTIGYDDFSRVIMQIEVRDA